MEQPAGKINIYGINDGQPKLAANARLYLIVLFTNFIVFKRHTLTTAIKNQ